MKKKISVISIILCLSMIFYTCKTSKIKNDRCIQLIKNSQTTAVLSESERNSIKSLFITNLMDDTKYQFYHFETDGLGFRHVKGYQFVNNLKVFSEELIFHFNKQDSCYLVSGDLLNATGLDNKQSLNESKAVEIFIRQVDQEKASMIDKAVTKGCFEVEFGYLKSDDDIRKFVKVWKVKPTDRAYPYAYISDDNSEIMVYDNGVRY